MLKIIKKLIIVLLFFTSCYNNKKTSEDFNFVPNLDLNKYLDSTSILNDLNKERFGSTGPTLSYVNDNYAVILNFNGILIYNLKEKCISGVIDNKGLGVNKIQGSEYTDIIGNDDYIFIYNSTSKNDGYMYSLKNNQLQQVYNNDNTLFKHKEIISSDISDKISSEIFDNKENVYWSALKNNDKIIVLELDVSSDTPWEILILSENIEKIEEIYLDF